MSRKARKEGEGPPTGATLSPGAHGRKIMKGRLKEDLVPEVFSQRCAALREEAAVRAVGGEETPRDGDAAGDTLAGSPLHAPRQATCEHGSSEHVLVGDWSPFPRRQPRGWTARSGVGGQGGCETGRRPRSPAALTLGQGTQRMFRPAHRCQFYLEQDLFLSELRRGLWAMWECHRSGSQGSLPGRGGT